MKPDDLAEKPYDLLRVQDCFGELNMQAETLQADPAWSVWAKCWKVRNRKWRYTV
jgi:hypothetical protein